MKRDDIIDLIKGIGIIFVYLGHTLPSGSLPFRAIFFVHMPLFFWVSGMVFDPGRYLSFGAIVKKCVIGLWVPYLFFALVAFAVKFDIQVPLLISRFPTQMYGLFARGDCVWALWFLVCLASTRVAYFVSYRVGIERNVWTKTLFACGFLVLAELSMVFLYPYRKAVPLMLSSVPAALFFFAIGRWMKPCLGKLRERLARLSVGLPVCLLSMLLCFGLAMYLPVRNFDLRSGAFSTLGLLPCFAGLLSVMTFAVLLERVEGRATWIVKSVGQYSLIFFAMESNVSHVFTAIVRACGFDAPEVWYVVNGMIGLKIGRIVFCLFVVALVAPAIDALVRKIQKKVEGAIR